MYRYDQYDHQIVKERVAQFKSQVERRLSGELSEDEFAASCVHVASGDSLWVAVINTDAQARSYCTRL